MDVADLAAFDRGWQDALANRDPRWFAYPAEPPVTQTDILELVKARRVRSILADRGLTAGRVLELGCGSAGMSIYLSNLGFDACAVDISLHALRVARVNAASHGSPTTLDVLSCDVFALPFADRSFDVVMSYGLLEHFDEPELVPLVGEALRVLKSGGLFLADIVPGLGRLTSRTLGAGLGFVGSFIRHLLAGRLGSARRLYAAHFHPFYENTLDDRQWAQLLRRQGLGAIRVEVCRPFPPLALSGRAEGAYMRLLQRAMPLWQRFDGRNSWLTRRWGWMYLAYGARA